MVNDRNSDRLVHRRIAKACETCRRKKSKCDGRTPCSECLRSAQTLTCEYRAKIRNRSKRTKDSNFNDVDSNVDTEGHDTQDEHDAAEDSDESHHASQAPLTIGVSQSKEVFISVNACLPACQLYYGPSSNFAFLQHIHQTFTEPSSRNKPQRRSTFAQPNVSDGDADQDGSLERFKHRHIFFGEDPNKSADGESNGYNRKSSSIDRNVFLPEALAQRFLDQYLATIHHMTPFVPETSLRRMLSQLYGSNGGDNSVQRPLSRADTAIILLVLANGATLTSHSAWVTELHDRARAEVPELDESVNLESVQISVLIAHVQATCGRPNACYLMLGSACRKAFASGLHKDIDYSCMRDSKSERREARKLTFWSLAFFERWLSFWLGRPSAVESTSIVTTKPTGAPLVRALSEMSDIIIQASRSIYEDARSAPMKLWESAQHIRLEICSLQRRMESTLPFKLDGTLKRPIDVDQVFLMHFFCHTWMITFRPFLIMAMSWKRSRTTRNRDGAKSQEPYPVDMWWLPEACQIAVEHARKLIHFFAQAAAESDTVKGLAFSASYLESACCLLFYDSNLDRTTIDNNRITLREALNCLEMMLETGPIKSVIQIVKQIITELEQIQGMDQTPNFPIGGLSSSSGAVTNTGTGVGNGNDNVNGANGSSVNVGINSAINDRTTTLPSTTNTMGPSTSTKSHLQTMTPPVSTTQSHISTPDLPPLSSSTNTDLSTNPNNNHNTANNHNSAAFASQIPLMQLGSSEPIDSPWFFRFPFTNDMDLDQNLFAPNLGEYFDPEMAGLF